VETQDGISPFRFNQSVIQMLAPPLKLKAFNFTSASDAV
jgi:hypothetical protein